MQHEEWSFQEACQWLSSEFGISTTPAGGYVPRPKRKPAVKPAEPVYTYIPVEMVDRLVTTENSLCKCLMRMFRPEEVEWITEEYRIGAYPMGSHDDSTVFPNIAKMADLANFTVFDICQQKAPEGDLKFDIADYIQLQHAEPF